MSSTVHNHNGCLPQILYKVAVSKLRIIVISVKKGIAENTAFQSNLKMNAFI